VWGVRFPAVRTRLELPLPPPLAFRDSSPFPPLFPFSRVPRERPPTPHSHSHSGELLAASSFFSLQSERAFQLREIPPPPPSLSPLHRRALPLLLASSSPPLLLFLLLLTCQLPQFAAGYPAKPPPSWNPSDALEFDQVCCVWGLGFGAMVWG